MQVIPVRVCPVCGGQFLAVAFVAYRTRGYCSELCELTAQSKRNPVDKGAP